MRPSRLAAGAALLLFLGAAAADRLQALEEVQRTKNNPTKGQPLEQRQPVLGKVAPEIKGEDIDGKAFKLSDYRGKVVVLDFWGNW
jgi:hypothetical protein